MHVPTSVARSPLFRRKCTQQKIPPLRFFFLSDTRKFFFEREIERERELCDERGGEGPSGRWDVRLLFSRNSGACALSEIFLFQIPLTAACRQSHHMSRKLSHRIGTPYHLLIPVPCERCVRSAHCFSSSSPLGRLQTQHHLVSHDGHRIKLQPPCFSVRTSHVGQGLKATRSARSGTLSVASRALDSASRFSSCVFCFFFSFLCCFTV